MKTFNVFAIVAIAILFASCKASQPTGPSAPTASVTQVAQTLDTIDAQLYLYANSTNGNDHAALQLTANWLQKQPNIQSVSVLDSTYLYFTLQSGLTGMYFLDEVDDSGLSLSRGAPGGGGTLERWSTLATNTIKNPSVLIFMPVFEEFYRQTELDSILSPFQNSGLGLNVTIVKDDQCTADIVNTFGNYGFVILDTHGAPNGFLIGTEIPDSLTTSESGFKLLTNVNLGITGYDNFQAGQIMLSRGLVLNVKTPWQKKRISKRPFVVVLTSKYVTGMPSLAGTVLFGNMCYSGQTQPVPAAQGVTTPIQTAFMSLNPISYYGFAYASGGSAGVSQPFAKVMEDSLLVQFITNTDSTGHCYLKQDGTEYSDSTGHAWGFSTENLYLEHAGQDNWSYEKCGDTIVDARDGQKYATVCIGNQKWMAQNLNYNAPGSIFYNNDPTTGALYGRMYDWHTVMQGAPASTASPSGVQGVCPKGWHIPSAAECATMTTTLGGDAIAGGAMKSTSSLWQSPNTGANNSSGLSILPIGYYAPSGPTFVGFGTNGLFWNTFEDTTNSFNGVAWGGTRDVQNTGANALVGQALENIMTSCRCVKDP
jgi:uncharacterized protein (TIGR02145 family)